MVGDRFRATSTVTATINGAARRNCIIVRFLPRDSYDRETNEKKPQFTRRKRAAVHPRLPPSSAERATVNSVNSANCVIPKRVVDRLDAAGLGWCEKRIKKIRTEGCGRSSDGVGGREKEKEEDALPHSHKHTHTNSFSPSLFLVSSAIPGTFSPKLAVASRRGDYKAPRFLPPLPPCRPPAGSRCNTQHLHTILISYLSMARSAGASSHTQARPSASLGRSRQHRRINKGLINRGARSRAHPLTGVPSSSSWRESSEEVLPFSLSLGLFREMFVVR